MSAHSCSCRNGNRQLSKTDKMEVLSYLCSRWRRPSAPRPLGQEDLAAADLPAIRAKGIRIGISTHSHEELAIALAVEPDYVALGPIYETKLKVMKWAPQGLDRIEDWKRRIGAMPLIAIGGITPERADGVVAAGADSVAVITDFFTHADPDARVRQWLAWADHCKD